MTDSREALTPDPRGLEDARRAIKYSTPPTFAVAYFALAEHARAERLGWELHARSLSDEEEEARITALEAQVATLREALEPFVDFIEKADGPVLHVLDYGKSEMGPGLMADAPDDRVLLRPDPSIPPLKIGHFRKARTALNTVDGDRT